MTSLDLYLEFDISGVISVSNSMTNVDVFNYKFIGSNLPTAFGYRICISQLIHKSWQLPISLYKASSVSGHEFNESVLCKRKSLYFSKKTIESNIPWPSYLINCTNFTNDTQWYDVVVNFEDFDFDYYLNTLYSVLFICVYIFNLYCLINLWLVFLMWLVIYTSCYCAVLLWS